MMLQNYTALATFIRVAKHLSFTKAAQEMHLTQGAVSTQIKQLEEELGFSLFHRQVRKIYLTKEGAELLKTVKPAFSSIGETIDRIKSYEGPQRLIVSMLGSFAAKWMIPRIPLFQRTYPSIKLHIHTGNELVDLDKDPIDCSIRFGLGQYSNVNVLHLSDEFFFPACSPDLVKGPLPLKNLEEISDYPLLHDVIAVKHYNGTWEHWAKEMRINTIDCSRGLRFDRSEFVIQAAIAKQGVALMRKKLVETDIKAGYLVPMIDHQVKSTFSYYFVTSKSLVESENVRLFREWLVEQMKE